MGMGSRSICQRVTESFPRPTRRIGMVRDLSDASISCNPTASRGMDDDGQMLQSILHQRRWQGVAFCLDPAGEDVEDGKSGW